MDQAEYDRKMAILSLGFGQKVKIAWKLTLSRIVPYLLLFLVASLILGVIYAIIVGLSVAIFPIFMILLLPLPIPVIYFMIGLYSSVLKCLDGKEQSFQLATILEPFRLWRQLLPTVLILYAIWFGLSIVLGIISIIPFIGAIISQVAIIFLMMFVSAYFFYISDNMGNPTNDLIGTPPKLVTPSINRWITGVGAYFLFVWIPAVILMVIGVIAFVMSDPYFFDDVMYGYYDTPDFNLLPMVIGCFFMFLGLAAAYLGSIITMFIFAIAYKQALLDRERMMSYTGQTQGFTPQGQPQGQYNPQGQQGAPQGPQQWSQPQQAQTGQPPFNPQAPQPTWQPPHGAQGPQSPQGPQDSGGPEGPQNPGQGSGQNQPPNS